MTHPPKLLDDGCLNREWAESLDAQELRAWIHDLLHDRELDLPGDREGEPDYLLIDLYEKGDIHAKRALAEAVAGLVDDMAKGATPDWHGEAADRLLFVAGTVCGQAIVPAVKRMIRSGRLIDPGAGIPGDIHFRLLQTLVALGVEDGLDFWKDQVAISPEQYLGIAFRALLLSPSDDAIQLLADLGAPLTPKMQADVRRALEVLPDRFGDRYVRDLIEDWPGRLAPEITHIVTPFLAAPASPDPPPASSWSWGPAALARQ